MKQVKKNIKNFGEKFDKYYRENITGSITRKQAGVIFRNFKLGNIKVDASWLYSWACDFAQPTTDTHSRDIASKLSMAVSALFDNDYEFAQFEIDKAYNASK